MTKKLITIIGVAALLATITQAAETSVAPASLSIPLTYPAGTTNYPGTNSPVIGNIKQRAMAIGGNICAAAPGATNVFTFAPMINAIDADTNSTAGLRTFTEYCIGTGPVYCSTNFDTGGWLNYKLISVVTTGTATNGVLTATNASRNALEYGIKINTP